MHLHMLLSLMLASQDIGTSLYSSILWVKAFAIFATIVALHLCKYLFKTTRDLQALVTVCAFLEKRCLGYNL